MKKECNYNLKNKKHENIFHQVNVINLFNLFLFLFYLFIKKTVVSNSGIITPL